MKRTNSHTSSCISEETLIRMLNPPRQLAVWLCLTPTGPRDYHVARVRLVGQGGSAHSSPPGQRRTPPLVLTHPQRQEDRGDREDKERYVADDVVDGAHRRSFSADINREEPCQQCGDAVDAKKKEPDIGPAAWRDA